MTAADKKITGTLGERYVCKKLEQSGFTIICVNYRKKTGEIDIVAEKNSLLIFTEVKTRTSNPLVRGICAVNPKKQERIVQTAQLYLEENNIKSREIRFDVAEVFVTRHEPAKIIGMNYYQAAFDPSGRDIFLFV